jgi:phenylalanyl-tRNA synthetase beta chain
MKISYNWLKEFVDFKLSPRDLAAQLTMTGLAVDAVDQHGADFILEFDITSNRPDCLSHLGIAREVAAVTGQSWRVPGKKLPEAPQKTREVTSVEIWNPDLCPRYAARVIRGVKIKPSPAWMVARLEAMGQRSINNVADITNYVLLEQGHPLHAFDFNRLGGRRIIVRTARQGERLITLDGEERALSPAMLLIADAEKAVALAGIMGGADSEISEFTTDVLLESAYFMPHSIRQTARALGMNTEASYRFERGTDYDAVVRACDRAAELIGELAGGQVLGEIIDVYPQKVTRGSAVFRRARYRELTGLEIELSEAERILRALGLQVEADVQMDALRAVAPSWRADLLIEEDLIEEVARISGYDRLRTTLPGTSGAGAYLAGESGRRGARRTLAAMGYLEAISFSFVNAAADRLLSAAPEAARLVLNNPIDETQAQMRTTLLAGLLEAVSRNFNHGTRNVRLFEIGKCFSHADGERPEEIERLALAATGARNESDWRQASERVDFYDLKGAIEAVGESLGLAGFSFSPTQSFSYLHPGRAAVISLTGREVGCLGQLHPRLAADYKFKQPVFVAELDFGALLAAEPVEVRYRPLPRFPTVVRDLSLLIDEAIAYARLEEAISELGLPELVGFWLFDLYTGKELPPGKRSVALSLRYRAQERTLTEAEIQALHERVVAKLRQEFGAELR